MPWRIVHLAGTEAVRVATGGMSLSLAWARLALPAAGLSTDAHVRAMDRHGVPVLDATHVALGKTTLHSSKSEHPPIRPPRSPPNWCAFRRGLPPNLQAGGQAPHPVVWAVRPAPER